MDPAHPYHRSPMSEILACQILITLYLYINMLMTPSCISVKMSKQCQTKCQQCQQKCQNICPCTCSLTPGLLQLGTGQLARSDACTTYSCPALRCTANSKSPETGFRIVGYDGAPLAPTPSSNNIQIVNIDARHPPWSLPKIHEGDGSLRIDLAGTRAPSICRDPELRHLSH